MNKFFIITVGAISTAATLFLLKFGIDRVQEAKARSAIVSINKTQQEYFMKNKQFLLKISSTRLKNQIESENYLFKIERKLKPSDGVAYVQHLAIPKKDGLRSYIGIVRGVHFAGGTTSMTRMCESNKPTVQSPPEPEFSKRSLVGGNGKSYVVGMEVRCPNGYSSVATQ